MLEVLKKLSEHDLAVAVSLIALVREVRLWHKQTLEHKAELLKIDKSMGQ